MDDLVKRGYAPGKYCNTCQKCGQLFFGEKRAYCCKGCAIAADRIEALTAERDAVEECYLALCDITRTGGWRHMTEAQEARVQAARAALEELKGGEG